MRRRPTNRALRAELDDRIETGMCVYCRAPAQPDRPLTREHVIPRARGGARKDARIIVPACARCNQSRGCQEIVLFLLARPRRISAFLDYLATLPTETIREMDSRIFAELYTAVWLLDESASAGGAAWSERLRHLCSGRRLHRRRYAARRIMAAVGERLERYRDRGSAADAPSCILPAALDVGDATRLDPLLAVNLARLVGTLSLVWGVAAERVVAELAHERARLVSRARVGASAVMAGPSGDSVPERMEEDDVSPLDAWVRRESGRRRTRVDHRRGRGARRGRAA